jgi:hypothetical protein
MASRREILALPALEPASLALAWPCACHCSNNLHWQLLGPSLPLAAAVKEADAIAATAGYYDKGLNLTSEAT